MTFVIMESARALLEQRANPRIELGLSIPQTPMAENPSRADLTRRVEKAEKLLQKGKTADALAEYLLILEADPQNDNVRQMAAELCLSLNKGPQAVRLLGELFERQVSATDATRASLTYKKLARYTNPTWEQKVRFGQLLEHSNKKLAIGTYENALEDLQKQGKKEEALLVVRRIVALEPSQANHLRLAELSADLGEHWQNSLPLRGPMPASGLSALTPRIRPILRPPSPTAEVCSRAARREPPSLFLSRWSMPEMRRSTCAICMRKRFYPPVAASIASR